MTKLPTNDVDLFEGYIEVSKSLIYERSGTITADLKALYEWACNWAKERHLSIEKVVHLHFDKFELDQINE